MALRRFTRDFLPIRWRGRILRIRGQVGQRCTGGTDRYGSDPPPPMDALVMAWAGAGFHNPAPALGGGRSRSIDPWREGHRASPASRSALGV